MNYTHHDAPPSWASDNLVRRELEVDTRRGQYLMAEAAVATAQAQATQARLAY